MGTLCRSEGGREGAGEGSLFVITLNEMRLFLSGLQTERMFTKRLHNCDDRKLTKPGFQGSVPGCSAASW